MDLKIAERWMRNVAEHGTPSDNTEAHRLVIAELDRWRAKATNIHAMLPRLDAYLPADLRVELAAHLYVLPPPELTADDIRRGQELAAELADGQRP